MVELLKNGMWSVGTGLFSKQYTRKRYRCPVCQKDTRKRWRNKNWTWCWNCYDAGIMDPSKWQAPDWKRKVLLNPYRNYEKIWKFFLRTRVWFATMPIPGNLLRTLNIPAHPRDPGRQIFFNHCFGYCSRLEQLLEILQETTKKFASPGLKPDWKQPGLLLPIMPFPGIVDGFVVFDPERSFRIAVHHKKNLSKGRILLRFGTGKQRIVWPDLRAGLDHGAFAAMVYPRSTLLCLPNLDMVPAETEPRVQEPGFCLEARPPSPGLRVPDPYRLIYDPRPTQQLALRQAST